MNIIGIDSSKVSTGLAIKSNKGEFLFNYTTKDSKYKWIKLTSDIVKYYHFTTNEEKDDTYSESEVKKLITFSLVSNEVLKNVKKHIDEKEETIIKMEGYSYGSGVGDIIDLVGMGQSIRIKLVENISNISKIEIIAPKRLKTLCCEYAYGKPKQATSEKTGKLLKKWIPSRNNDGIVGGDFTKHEMFKAMKDCDLKSPLSDFYKEHFEDLYKMKKIIKPFEDINDAIWLINVD